MSVLRLFWSFLFPFACFALPQVLQGSLNSTHLDQTQRETCPDTNEELVSTLNGLLKCCKKCPPGEGMLQLCTNQTETICRPCQDGSEFSLEASTTAKCMQCKQCQELHPFAKFRQHCTPTSDAVCECVAGYFFIEAHSTCQSCTKCPPGYGAERPCEWNRDSVCQPCPPGTWSLTDSTTERCQTCKKCKPGQIEMRPCTATQNTLCCPLHNPSCQDSFEDDNFDERGISHDLNRTLDSMNIKTAFRVDEPKYVQNQGQFSGEQAPPQMIYGDDYPMITIYCSLLGLVILTLLIYVFYKLWQQRLSVEDVKSIEAGVFHPAFAPLKSGGGKSKISMPSTFAKATADRQHLLDEPHQSLVAPQRPSMPETLLRDLAEGLAPDNRWKPVGGLLGFNEESLQNFEKLAALEVSNDQEIGVVAAQQMLTSWHSARSATDPNPLTSLVMALECALGTGHLSRHLKKFMNASSASLHSAILTTQPTSQLPSTAVCPKAPDTKSQ